MAASLDDPHRVSGLGSRVSGLVSGLGFRLSAAHGTRDPSPGPANYVLSGNAATPGSTAPPRNSSDAPPPVEMWLIRLGHAGRVHGRHRVAAADDRRAVHAGHRVRHRHRARARTAPISKTPIGPFHTTVLAPAMIEAIERRSSLGPMSRPIRSPIAGPIAHAPRSRAARRAGRPPRDRPAARTARRGLARAR